MNVAYAASQAGEHGGEANIGEVILHHVLDAKILDLGTFSITKHVVMMWIASALLVLVFRYAFRERSLVPTGLANMLEAIIMFLRDEVIIPNMGEQGKRYLPYLLTVFFFILFCNLLGLIPFCATATGNVSVTAALAIMSLLMIQVGGIKTHGVKHHFQNLIPHGIPTWLLPIMLPVEIMGQFTKPFALCIRLFANMTAGHIVILSFISMIFILKSLVIAPISVFFALFISLLELFVAFLQAYIFTMLTSLFMGMSIHPQH
ncbi:MAG: F0F1 ATP synthase subunit A [Candidatus Tectimicrobiota bacterium]